MHAIAMTSPYLLEVALGQPLWNLFRLWSLCFAYLEDWCWFAGR
jgi:hypothetical protein